MCITVKPGLNPMLKTDFDIHISKDIKCLWRERTSFYLLQLWFMQSLRLKKHPCLILLFRKSSPTLPSKIRLLKPFHFFSFLFYICFGSFYCMQYLSILFLHLFLFYLVSTSAWVCDIKYLQCIWRILFFFYFLIFFFYYIWNSKKNLLC